MAHSHLASRRAHVCGLSAPPPAALSTMMHCISTSRCGSGLLVLAPSAGSAHRGRATIGATTSRSPRFPAPTPVQLNQRRRRKHRLHSLPPKQQQPASSRFQERQELDWNEGEEGYEQAMEDSKECLVVTCWSATWCRKCKFLKARAAVRLYRGAAGAFGFIPRRHFVKIDLCR